MSFRKILKRTLLTLGILFGIAVLGLAGIYLYNHRPRPIPPDLWTEKDLEVSFTVANNGWDLLPDADLAVKEVEDENSGSLTTHLYYLKKSPKEFWDEMSAEKENMTAIVDANKEGWGHFEKILATDGLMDTSLLEIGVKGKNTDFFRSFHALANLHIILDMVDGNREQAYALLQKVFHYDLQWFSSARSLISQMRALEVIENDVRLLSAMTTKALPSGWGEIQTMLGKTDWKNFNIKRGIIAEYIRGVQYLRFFSPESMAMQPTFWSQVGGRIALVCFDPIEKKQTLNEFYQDYMEFTNGTKPIPKNYDEVAMGRLEKSPWMNRCNEFIFPPHFSLSIIGQIKKSKEKIETIQKQVAHLLTIPAVENTSPPLEVPK